MNYYIVHEDSDYADEFNLKAVAFYKSELSSEALLERICLEVIAQRSEGFSEEFEDALSKIDYDVEQLEFTEDMIEFCKDLRDLELSFGTNEAVYFDGLTDMLNNLEITQIEESEYLTLTKLLGNLIGLGAIL